VEPAGGPRVWKNGGQFRGLEEGPVAIWIGGQKREAGDFSGSCAGARVEGGVAQKLNILRARSPTLGGAAKERREVQTKSFMEMVMEGKIKRSR